MILERKETDTIGHWDLGAAKLVLNEGHAEYPFMPVKPSYLTDHALGDEMSVYRFDFDPEKPAKPRPVRYQTEGWWDRLVERGDVDEQDKEFATIVVVDGPVYRIALSFYHLSVRLDPWFDPADYTPGGDDDTFDYWPSGMRLLYALACDLDDLTRGWGVNDRAANPGGTRYRDRYTEVLNHAEQRSVPEMGGTVPLARRELR